MRAIIPTWATPALLPTVLILPVRADALPAASTAPLAAFAKVFLAVHNQFVTPLTAKTLITRALQGLGSAPSLAGPQQARIVAAATAKVGAMSPEDVEPLFRTFGGAVDAFAATPGKPTMEDIARAAIAGMVNGLDDDTRFLPPASSPASPDVGVGLRSPDAGVGLRSPNAGVGLRSPNAGVGLRLIAIPDGLLVVKPIRNGPAAQGGVQPGDVVVAIDGRPIQGVPGAEAVAAISGKPGSSVTLELRRAGAAAPITVTLSRAVVRAPSAMAAAIGSVAYLQVDEFTPGTAEVLHHLFAEVQARGAPVRGVVLDLRYNIGGRLDEAIDTADELLPPGAPIAAIKRRPPNRVEAFTSHTGDMTAGLPMVVLVNGTTGSGSEIVAAALRAGRHAIVMGGHTTGTGGVQSVVTLPPLGSIRLTTGRIFLASGEDLKPPGVVPQIQLAEHPGEIGAPAVTPADAVLARIVSGLPSSPPAGAALYVPDHPEQDFEVREACAVVTALAQAGSEAQ